MRNSEIIKMQEIISELGYSQIKLENDSYVELLFYDNTKKPNMIFVVSYNKSEPDRCPYVGNIAIGPNNKPNSGFFMMIREVNKKNVIEALKYGVDTAPIGGSSFINYHEDFDKVIKEYASLYDYSLFSELKG